jgi:hypothetical protein
MFLVSLALFSFLQAVLVRMLGSHEGTLAQQAISMSDSMHAFITANTRDQTQ